MRVLRIIPLKATIQLGLLFVVTAAAVFALTLSAVGDRSVSGQEADGDHTGVDRSLSQGVTTIAEAEILTGYKVASPSFLPDGFERGVIVVSTPAGNLPKRVTQTWYLPVGTSGVTLVQDPELDGIVGGTAATIKGRDGEKLVSTSNSDPSLSVIDFYWRDGDIGFVLSAVLAEDMTESVFEELVDSVGLPA